MSDDQDKYVPVSRTMSGWRISRFEGAPPDRRWRAVHPGYGETKYFSEREHILAFTTEDMARRAARYLRGVQLRRKS